MEKRWGWPNAYVQSGIQNICIITGRGKRAIEDHFDVSFELEHLLSSRHQEDLLSTVRKISALIEVTYIRQREALGLGHAVFRAKNAIGENPFAVVLSDDVIHSKVPCLLQLMEVYEGYNHPVLALMIVPPERISAHGVVSGGMVSVNRQGQPIYKIDALVEKPTPGSAPSDLAIIGRYVLTPDVFQCLESTCPGTGDEIQLTDALHRRRD